MGTAERREREREIVRNLIIEAARDLLSEQGLDAVSIRAIAERVEYSPGTIYLYFRGKDELIREVVHEGFRVMTEYTEREIAGLPETAPAAAQYGAMGRAYARFAIENPAYFRVMFELPGSAHVECAEPEPGTEHGAGYDAAVRVIERAVQEGSFVVGDPSRVFLIGWGLIHGLTSLYLGGHFAGVVTSHEEFLGLVEDAMRSMYVGRPAAGST